MPAFELHYSPTPDELAQAVASAWVADVEKAVPAGKPYSAALSGGRFVQKFFAATVALAQARGVSFETVHFFWADERCVPPESPDSNYILAQESLFTPLNIPAGNIHRLRGEIDPEAAVTQAIKEIKQSVPLNAEGQPVLDFVQLGLGEDGHIASLFPNVTPEVINCSAPFLAIDNSPKPPPRRISLSFKTIASARQVWVVVSGTGKLAALQASLEPNGTTPCAHLLRLKSEVQIFHDLAALK